jgi:D-alanine-D-alanine ligase
MNTKTNVAVVFGGISSEHDISIKTGVTIISEIDRNKYHVKPIFINKQGGWHIFNDFLTLNDSTNLGFVDSLKNVPAKKLDAALAALYESKIDIVYIGLHGKGGEDGTIQAMLEFAGIPYTGCGVLACALAMDKVRTQELLQAHSIAMPLFVKYEHQDFATIKKEVKEKIGYPCVLKPVDGGSSAATFMLNNEDGIEEKIKTAYSVTKQIMFQKFVQGEEVTSGILDIDPLNDPITLPPTQITPKSGQFFDIESKYIKGASDEITPPNMSADTIKKIQTLALKAHKILGCTGLSRTDMIVTKDNIYVLETNTVPGMTITSIFPQQAAYIGISMPELLHKLIQHGLHIKR